MLFQMVGEIKTCHLRNPLTQYSLFSFTFFKICFLLVFAAPQKFLYLGLYYILVLILGKCTLKVKHDFKKYVRRF